VSAGTASTARGSRAWEETRRVVGAFAYLRKTSLVNAVRGKLRRLKQPKYAIGAAVMTGYVGLFFVMPMLLSRRPAMAWSPDMLVLATGLASLAVFVMVATAWLLPGDRAAVAFSEAEVAFLFPAPLGRVALINFSLLRSQAAIFLSAFLLSLVFGRGRGLPGNALQHATALWLLMATLRLHFLGASFTHERLFDAGWQPWLRRVVGAFVLLGVVGGVVGWLATSLPPPRETDFASPAALGAWLVPVLSTPPASVVLAPFRWLVAPLFAGGHGWAASLLPAFGLLAANYLWVVRSHVAFEEASIDRARQSALKVQAFREGRWRSLRKGTAQVAPFALSARGAPALAFLWQGLIAAGGAGRPRNALWLLLALAALVFGFALTPFRPAVAAIGGVGATFAMFMPLFGPMTAQRALRDTLDRLDVYKATPVPGWQVALGQLLAPVTLIVAVQWLMLAVAAMAWLATGMAGKSALPWTVLFAMVLLTPPLSMLVLCVPFAGLLWFPAWAAAISSRGGGFEVAGQRIAYGFLFMLTLGVALLPAALAGGGLWGLGFLLESPRTGLVVGALAATAVVVGEVALALRLLGRRIEAFDLSVESR
jgi:hypothetical protein